MKYKEGFEPIAEKMRAEELPKVAIDTFYTYYQQLVAGETGLISEAEIEPVAELADADKLEGDLEKLGKEALKRTVAINLNGGLGTSMGLAKAKSLLVVKDDLSFLDILALQARSSGVPLIMMNSFATQADSLEALDKYPELKQSGLPLDFLQHKVPKISQSDFTAVEWAENSTQEWCPPGHGDIYTAMQTSGLLEQLLEKDYEYAFISNADNLGAYIDERILGYFADRELPILMEVADRTHADRKGGHLARLADGSGQLILRESAQCPAEDESSFQDIEKHRYFNTNSLWINLRALKDKLDEQDGVMGLPIIRNSKTVDPRNPDSTPVYQLETAMGAAIAVFEGAEAIRVPRSRFAPVKTCDDLLVVRSDATVLTENYQVVQNPERKGGAVVVQLDKDYYRLVDEMEDRFPDGPPSLINCNSLTVEGDIKFGNNVVIKGDVVLQADDEQVAIGDGVVLGE